MYAMGWTQHTVGAQNIRTMSIIQLLLGNMGWPGRVNAMRGESNVQGSTDYGLLFNVLPGYNPTPVAADQTLNAYNDRNTRKPGFQEPELVEEPSQVHRQLPQGDVRRKGHSLQ